MSSAYPSLAENPLENDVGCENKTAQDSSSSSTLSVHSQNHSNNVINHKDSSFSDTVNNSIEAPPIIQSDGSLAIQSAIDALGSIGGEITLESDVTLSSADVILPSNIVFSGVHSNITIHLDAKRLNIGKNAVNVTVKSLVINAANLGERNAFVVYSGAQNISIENIVISDDVSNMSSLLSLGNNINLEKVSFKNVSNAYPIEVAGSHTYVNNCFSSDWSTRALVSVAGGISDVHIERNLAVNRPLLSAGYSTVSSSDIWVLDNTVENFPLQTYGMLVMGGTGAPLQAPFENVCIKGNTVKAGLGAFNGIAIYGLSRNIVIANNTVDQSLSGHNAIGVASGVNVIVTENVVFGCRETNEGGIEVESNPIHNRLIGISENVNVTKNIIYGSVWGVYVRIMVPDHVNWGGNPLKSKNILIEGNIVSNCAVGINLLHGDGIIVRDNYISDNFTPLAVDKSNVSNCSIRGNMGYGVLEID